MSEFSLRPGDFLGAYCVVSHLGSGGMGQVYLVEDPRLDRKVALKILSPDLAGDEASLKRFMREARAASALNHPSILTIFEFGRAGDIAFIASEYIEGETLRARLRRGALPVADAVRIATQIADALGVAHAAGVLHRDIKPENVMIRSDGLVKVLDFGVAKRLMPAQMIRPNSDTMEHATAPGMVVGTIAYMSPEQVRGANLDTRSDIFSLGALLYEMVSGHTPFDGDTGSHVMVAILDAKPKPLAHPALQRIAAKALEKKPDDRYQRAEDLAADLRNLGADDERTLTLPRVVSSPGRLRMAVAAIAIAVLLAAGIAAWRMRSQPTARIPIAVADFDNQTGEKALDGLSGMLITSLEQSRRLSVMTRARMFDVLRRSGRKDVSRIDESVGREIAQNENLRGLVTASVTRLGALYVIDVKMIDPRTSEYLFAGKEEGRGQEQIPEMLDRLSERLRVTVREAESEIAAETKEIGKATTMNLEAYRHYFVGEQMIMLLRLEEADAELKKAVELDPNFALAWVRRAYIIRWDDVPTAERRARAREYVTKARQLSENLPQKEQLTIDSLLAEISGDTARAVALRRQILARFPDDKDSVYTVGDYAMHDHDFKTAREFLTRTLALDAHDVRAHHHLAFLAAESGDYASGLADARRWVRDVPSDIATSYLAWMLYAAGEHREALAVAKRQADEKPQDRTHAFSYLSRLRSTGDFAGARREAEARWRKVPDVVESGLAEVFLAGVAIEEGRYAEASRLLERAEAIAAASGSAMDTAHYDPSLDGRALKPMLLLRAGRKEEAHAAAEAIVARGTATSPAARVIAFQVLLRLGDVEAARRAARIDSETSSYRRKYFRQLLDAGESVRRGDPGGAVDILLPRISMSDAYCVEYLVQCALAARRFDVAATIAPKLAAAADPFFGLAYREELRGRIDEARGNREAAKVHYHDALARFRDADPGVRGAIEARLAKL